MLDRANVIEVFSSIQGEGKYVGVRQIFVRFSGCNLKCRYCDTLVSHAPYKHCTVEKDAGSRRFTKFDNPVDLDNLGASIRHLLRLPHHSVSFTGGEPLYRADYIHALAKEFDCKLYLETNGTLYEELDKVLDDLDFISMDIKLPSVTGKELWEEHRRFLKKSMSKDLFVKLVISGETTSEEFDQAIALIKGINFRIPLILQPVTPVNGCCAASPTEVLLYLERALAELYDVRVIPQTHKMIKQM